MNKELSERKEELKRNMEKRKHLQQISEILKNIKGIIVLEINEVDTHKLLENTDYFVYDKVPESRISCHAENEEICEWIINCMDWHNEDIIDLLFNDFCAKVKLIDTKTAVDEFWNKSGKCITTLSEHDLKEVCEDSRDEYYYLFDKYVLTNYSKVMM